ncbi:PstS family phosphate ABC transporter substrate-binding protein [Falsiroseomonas sp.]|uniref:PstS family phosphate ABC transporter substrate-binding protein n=1 Tax=Falsiroseomonas sp. TaxID=2870721 RepID=UPI003567A0B0
MRQLVLALAAGGLALAGVAADAAAQTAMTLRDRLVVVSSASSAGLTQLLTRNFTERFAGVVPPATEAVGSAAALERFCTGIGPQTPDLAIVTRRMPRAMVENCSANGVRDIVEVQIGLGAVVLVTRRGEAMPALSSRQVWEAVAAERPVDEEFVPNTTRFWSDIAPGLPRSEIRVIVPDHGAGTRALFDDLVMESGCRYVKEIRLLFEAAYRRGKCVNSRIDGRLIAVPSDHVVAALLSAPPGTIAAMSYDQLVSSGGNLVALALDGTPPTAATIGSLDYGPVRTFYLYAKRQHSRSQDGVGVVRGIREFLLEATGEQAGGPGGYLTAAGLLPLMPADRAAQRRIAEHSTVMSR